MPADVHFEISGEQDAVKISMVIVDEDRGHQSGMCFAVTAENAREIAKDLHSAIIDAEAVLVDGKILKGVHTLDCLTKYRGCSPECTFQAWHDFKTEQKCQNQTPSESRSLG